MSLDEIVASLEAERSEVLEQAAALHAQAERLGNAIAALGPVGHQSGPAGHQAGPVRAAERPCERPGCSNTFQPNRYGKPRRYCQQPDCALQTATPPPAALLPPTAIRAAAAEQERRDEVDALIHPPERIEESGTGFRARGRDIKAVAKAALKASETSKAPARSRLMEKAAASSAAAPRRRA